MDQPNASACDRLLVRVTKHYSVRPAKLIFSLRYATTDESQTCFAIRAWSEPSASSLSQTEKQSHYFDARLSDQFDAVIHFDETRALEPLERYPQWESGEPPETFPT